MPNEPITFDYRFEKVQAALVYLASDPRRVTRFDKKKASTLLFLADRAYLLRYGRPIFGEDYRALKEGAVAQRTLDRLNAFEKSQLRRAGPQHPLAKSLGITKIQGHKYPIYVAKVAPNLSALSELERQTLDDIITKYGTKTFDQLKEPIHPKAWEKAWQRKPGNRQAWPMRYEDFFDGEEPTEGALEEMVEHSRIKQALSGLR